MAFINRSVAAAGLSLGLVLSTAVLAQETPQRGGTAIFALAQDPPTVNPVLSSGIPDRQVGCIIYEPLVNISPDYKVLPQLAKSMSVTPDGMTYTFELNDVKWSDGKPFTSEDVRYSFVEVAAKFSPAFGPVGRVLDKVETPTPHTVVVKLKEPFGPFVQSLTCLQGGSILPSHLFKGTNPRDNPATTSKPVGTGAFVLTDWKHGDYVRLKRNPDYYVAGKPYLDEVIGKVIPTTAARIQALQVGEVDQIRGLLPTEFDIIRATPGLQVVTTDAAPAMDLLFFNLRRKPFDDVRVRRALMMATDRDYLFERAFFKYGNVGTQPFTPEIAWAVDPNLDYRKMYPFDVAKANALLDEAGYKRGADGKRFSASLLVWSTDYPEFTVAASAIKSMWQAVGVDARVESVERPSLVKRVFTDGDFDLTFQNYG